MTTLQILKDALKLIENSDNWTQYTLARDANGHMVAPRSAAARSWCASGALRRTSMTSLQWGEVLTALRSAMDTPIHLGFYNDRHSHEDIILLFKKAIAHLEEKNQWIIEQ